MKKRHAAAALLFALLLSGQAAAMTVDVSAVKCEDFLKSDRDTIGVYLTWMMGYYANADDETTIDTDKMQASGVKLATYCKEHPSIGLLNAAKKALDRKD